MPAFGLWLLMQSLPGVRDMKARAYGYATLREIPFPGFN
jgi:hypothetical protein